MSSSGLDWKPILDAWLKTRTPKEVTVFQQLFEESFAVMYSWGTQNLNLTMKVLQINIVHQVSSMFKNIDKIIMVFVYCTDFLPYRKVVFLQRIK